MAVSLMWLVLAIKEFLKHEEISSLQAVPSSIIVCTYIILIKFVYGTVNNGESRGYL